MREFSSKEKKDAIDRANEPNPIVHEVKKNRPLRLILYLIIFGFGIAIVRVVIFKQ